VQEAMRRTNSKIQLADHFRSSTKIFYSKPFKRQTSLHITVNILFRQK